MKVQRPKVKETVELDIDLLYWLAHAIERSIPEAKLYQPVKMVDEFDRAISAELDFVNEADNAERFARNFEGKRNVRFPKVYREASARRVLTLERFYGAKIEHAIADGHSGETIAKAAVEIIIQQVFEDGFFHGDPHPGNLFILGKPEAPVIGMIDLGLVGHLTPTLRDRIIDLMVAAVREDHRGIADALWTIARRTKKVDRQVFEAEVAILSQKYLGKRRCTTESASQRALRLAAASAGEPAAVRRRTAPREAEDEKEGECAPAPAPLWGAPAPTARKAACKANCALAGLADAKCRHVSAGGTRCQREPEVGEEFCAKHTPADDEPAAPRASPTAPAPARARKPGQSPRKRKNAEQTTRNQSFLAAMFQTE